jgi:hypothetical protein
MTPLLLISLLLCSAPARAAAGEDTPDRFTLRVQRMSGHDAEQDKAVRLLRRLSGRYPSLLAPGVIAGARFQIVKEKANQSFDQQNKALVINPVELFAPWADPSFYRGGSAAEPEAVLFHELLHAWSLAHPGLEDDYQSRVSGGRQEKFIAEANEGHRPAKEHREKIRDALLRVRIGAMTREQYAGLPGPPGQSNRERALSDYDRVIKTTPEQAEEIVRAFQAEAEAGAGMLARLLGVASKDRPRGEVDKEIAAIREKEPARFEAARAEYERWVKENSTASKLIEQGRKLEAELAVKYKIPGRRADDRHAGDSPSEWFAYGGETAAYAASPERLLTAEERDFWTGQFALMKIRPGAKRPGLLP